MTIVYVPNVGYTFSSNEPTAKLEYAPDQTEGMIANGVLVGSYDGDEA